MSDLQSESMTVSPSERVCASQSETLRFEFLSWINDELRKQADIHEIQAEEEKTFVERVKSFLAAAMS